jgi:hypothetical protein
LATGEINVALDGTMLAADLAFMLADLADTLTFGSQTIPCAFERVARGAAARDDAGLWPDDAVRFSCAASSFSGGTLPTPGASRISHQGVTYKVLGVERTGDLRHAILVCAEGL